MRSTTPAGRLSKGSVSLISSNDRLQLRFSYGGKRHYLSLGLADTSTNRKLAELRASEIEKDILYERFDETLQKHKPDLDELWNKYSEFKKPQISPSTFAKDFVKHRNHIAKLPTRSLNEASVIQDWLLNNLSNNAAKRCLTQIKACCNWAVERKLIDVNPFALMTIQVSQSSSEELDINPFSKEERDLIINTFANDRYYKHYTDYVRFLFFTGCRPSEAIALKWKHIRDSVIQFRESAVISENGLVVKEGLKTQKKRDFPINSELQVFFKDIRPEIINPESFVFVSPKGKLIDHHNFSTRAWKTILAKCGVPYRKSYQTRHTFITLCVEANINSTAIGRWTGTSAKMIDKHYGATNFTNLRPPDLF